jgi:tRNA-specific 2-thiouridylase
MFNDVKSSFKTINFYKKIKVVLGISGGVDSAVTALMLQEQGYEVQAVFMQNWVADQNDPYCSINQDLNDAKAVCDKLQIPFSIINFSREYWRNVFQYFLDEYAAGRTPNPDVMCNKEIKFKAFLQHAIDLGADCIATGHYARIDKVDNYYRLRRGKDNNKDQSYFLYTLNQKQLAKSLFPIGNLTKDEVRAIAKKAGLPNYAKKDSTGICFIGERNFKEFLKEYLLDKPGDIVTEESKIIGRHDGLMFYTLGQRKGLKIGGCNNAKELPWYVINKDIKNNRLYVAQGHDHPRLLANSLSYKNEHWISGIEPKFSLQCEAQIRYRSCAKKCTVNAGQVQFKEPQWAIAPGQSVVFYLGDHCLGGGIII